MMALKVVLTAPEVPPDILQTLLNLAEFMEHEVEVRRRIHYYINTLCTVNIIFRCDWRLPSTAVVVLSYYY